MRDTVAVLFDAQDFVERVKKKGDDTEFSYGVYLIVSVIAAASREIVQHLQDDSDG